MTDGRALTIAAQCKDENFSSRQIIHPEYMHQGSVMLKRF